MDSYYDPENNDHVGINDIKRYVGDIRNIKASS